MLNNNSFSWKLYDKAPIVGIIRGQSLETTLAIVKSYLEAGFYTIEVTMNTPDAEKIIATLVTNFPELNVGAGTVCNKEDLEKALNAGSQFIVTPIIDEEIIKTCVSRKIPIFPGAFTPTEIYKAWSLGASAVKIFPATQLGVTYIKDVLGPLNTIKLLPTGGVSKENIKSFFDVGVVGVGMGSSLLDKNLIKNNDFEGLKNHFISIKKEIENYIK
ncbi:bifunctional 4-hydroxy-2-oxoglutarate aldolase/2-dehydro-3-deoxy-phosphogluconate aldolase [Polaribacter sp. PL03]|uniref:bifunctional 4-hydroxy-2-oxoglutarate aldolase/2-dehydro-3-deoxy-phosphogluconate aldolase n=1 Tax=Polaribacter sp. PL03 TaxID=3088353 RepID=UPI0029CF2E29|nr:bifunctional 4-hydroxy-2-oxoglutarate aldolase/2-dehydro-3-deoxy-phosphogluconate aldolase [Polaribacter sp. PL03]MDX6747904.1 bifunctional 4-hydroxy-2-oxoglutarate aldolase/2-dehydro-3-deoxy-phosphogluconate aldolase [Polaribacter sp. PL03]